MLCKEHPKNMLPLGLWDLAAASRMKPSEFFNFPREIRTSRSEQLHAITCLQSYPTHMTGSGDQALEVWHADFQLWANLDVLHQQEDTTTSMHSRRENERSDWCVGRRKLHCRPSAGGMSLPARCHFGHALQAFHITPQTQIGLHMLLTPGSRKTSKHRSVLAA